MKRGVSVPRPSQPLPQPSGEGYFFGLKFHLVGALAPSSSYADHGWFHYLSLNMDSLRTRFDKFSILSVLELPH
jgi:hypothetical protein